VIIPGNAQKRGTSRATKRSLTVRHANRIHLRPGLSQPASLFPLFLFSALPLPVCSLSLLLSLRNWFIYLFSPPPRSSLLSSPTFPPALLPPVARPRVPDSRLRAPLKHSAIVAIGSCAVIPPAFPILISRHWTLSPIHRYVPGGGILDSRSDTGNNAVQWPLILPIPLFGPGESLVCVEITFPCTFGTRPSCPEHWS
jgi:hypothetical protein